MSTATDRSNEEPIDAPGYAQLRMTAEWAGAVRDQRFGVRYDRPTGRVEVAREGMADVVLYTAADARRPRVVRIDFEVSVNGVVSSYVVDGSRASALFWGESAVEKFVLSYYASVAAEGAALMLGRLLGAWYGYRANVVQVCALVHLCGTEAPPPGTPLLLEDTVGFLCLGRSGRLELLTLPEFERVYGTGYSHGTGKKVTTVHGPVSGWSLSPKDENIVVRESAEFVSGLRGQEIAFMLEEEYLYPYLLDPDPGATPPQLYLFTSAAQMIRPDRPAPSRVTVELDDARAPVPVPVVPDEIPMRTPDSIFWSDGAVERFVVPYYASVKGRRAWPFLGVLMGKWDGTIPPDSNSLHVPEGRLDEGAMDTEGESEVFAITHLPRSEYEAAIESRTMLLTFRDGARGRHPLLSVQRSTRPAGAEYSEPNTASAAM